MMDAFPMADDLYGWRTLFYKEVLRFWKVAFQTVAAQLAEVYIASRTMGLTAASVVWRLAEDRDADEDLDVMAYWLTSQLPPAMQICHHLHGGMGMDITYPMHRYYSSVKDLTRLLGGPAHRLDLVGAQCT